MRIISHADEPQRLIDLKNYGILDTPPESTFDEITKLAATICNAKMAAVSFLDDQRQWFKSTYGLNLKQTPRDHSFCLLTIENDNILVVENAQNDQRFFQNELFLNAPFIRFYAGVPLITPNKNRIGTLCVMDTEKKVLTETQITVLNSLAQHLMDLLELRLKNETLTNIYQQYRDVQEMAQTGGWMLDVENNTCSWSEIIYDIFQVSKETPPHIISEISYFPLLEREKLSALIEETIKNKKPFDTELEFYDKDGNHKWVRSQAKPVIHDNKVVKVVGTFQNITEQKNIQNELLKSRRDFMTSHQLLDLAHEGSSLGIWDWNLITNAVTFDRRWAEMLGYNLEEIEMNLSSWESRVHPDDLAKCYQDIKAYLDGKTSIYENIHRMKHKNGTWVYIMDRGKFSAWDESGKPIRFTGSHLDVNKQKQQEIINAEISDLRARFIELSNDRKKLFDYFLEKLKKLTQSEYGFIGEILEDDHGKFLKTLAITDISWNKETSKWYQQEINKGLVFRNLNTLFGEVIKTGKLLIANQTQDHPNAGGVPVGHPSLNSFMGIPLFFNGKLIAMAGLANRPDGFSHELIHELTPLTEVIGDMINAINKEEELEFQKQLAMHNSKLASIGQLAAGVGHEINNPLAIISGHLAITEEILQLNGAFNKDLGQRFNKMDIAVNRIANIVKGLRTFARSDDSQLSSFNLFDLVTETVNMLKDIYFQEGVELNLHGVKNDVHLMGNRGRIQQVLVNLLSNAKDATEGNELRQINLNVACLNEAIKIEVADNGSGIPEEIKDKIFEPFFTTKAINKGTGIGLSLVNTIVKEHHGKLELKSTPGKGTSFIITFLPSKTS
jgi:PAS domain S-box-containing protein